MNIDRPDTIHPKSQHELPICRGATPVQIVATPSGYGQWAYWSRQKQKGPAEKKQTNSSISSFLECFRYPVKVCLLVRLRMFLDENLPGFLFCDFRGQTERCRTFLITWMWWIIIWN